MPVWVLAHVCTRVWVRALSGSNVCTLPPPAAQGTVASSPGKGGGHQTPRDPAGSSLGWIHGAQSHDTPRAHPHFPSARRMPGGSLDDCPGGSLLCSQPRVVGDVGHLDVQLGTLLAELRPPGTLAPPAFSKPPGEERRGVMALGCSGAGVRRVLPAEWGPVLPPRICPSLWLLGTGQLAWGWAGEPGLSAQHFPLCWSPGSLPGSQVRSEGLQKGQHGGDPFPGQDWPGGLTQALSLGACPMATPGGAQVLSSQQRHLEDSPRSPCHTRTGCSHNTWDSPVQWHHPPWGPRVLTVCVGGPGVTPGESGNQAQVSLCWGAAAGKGASLGPAWSQEGGRGGGAPTQLCTHRSGHPGP